MSKKLFIQDYHRVKYEIFMIEPNTRQFAICPFCNKLIFRKGNVDDEIFICEVHGNLKDRRLIEFDEHPRRTALQIKQLDEEYQVFMHLIEEKMEELR